MPQHQGMAGASDPGTINIKTFAKKDILLKERTRKHAERAKARRIKVEEHHKAVSGRRQYLGIVNPLSLTCSFFQGNAHFRKGKYREAIAEFEVAIQINGPSALYFSNMAAAWLKLKE